MGEMRDRCLSTTAAVKSITKSAQHVCPRMRREDEAEEEGDSSERRHLDGVEMSRHCTDWPRTLDQRAKAYIALVLAPCSPRLTMFCPPLRPAPSRKLECRESPQKAHPPSAQKVTSLACRFLEAACWCRGTRAWWWFYTRKPSPHSTASSYPLLSAGTSPARIIK
jgi:hypothetical protein